MDLDIFSPLLTPKKEQFDDSKMLNTEILEEQVASVMAALTKTAVVEICKVINSGFTEVIREVCLKENELETLRTKVFSLTNEGSNMASMDRCNVDNNVTPIRRSIAVQVPEQGEAECSTLIDTPTQGEAVVELIVKVEGGEEHGTLGTNQNSGEDSAVGCSASGSCFPDLANLKYEECHFDDPNISSSQSDTSPITHSGPDTTHSGPDTTNQLHALASPLCRHNGSLLPADFGPVKEEESVGAPGVALSDDRQFFSPSAGEEECSMLIDTRSQGEAVLEPIGKAEGREEHGTLGTTQNSGEDSVVGCSASGNSFPGSANQECNFDAPLISPRQSDTSTITHSGPDRASQPPALAAPLRRPSSALLPADYGPVKEKEKGVVVDTPGVTCSYDRQFSCNVCNKSFKKHFHLQQHKLILHNEPFTCHYCRKHFSQASDMKTHQCIHTREKPYLCPVGGETFSEHRNPTRNQLKQHQKLHNRNAINKLRQKAAQSSLLLPTDLPLLSSTSSPQGEHTFHCGKSLNRSTNVKQHQRIHRGERPYECSICGRQFTQKTSLLDHQLTHTRERPHRSERSQTDDHQFSCNVCNKSFKMTCQLQQHKLLHSPIACHYCGKRFTYMSTLKEHQRVHTGERPYRCPMCGQTFTRHSSLTRHQKKVHQ